MGNTKPVRFNPPQREVISTGAKTAVFAGGRRPGKTAVFAAPLFLRSLQRMPRSSGVFAVPSCRHGLINTLPGTPAAPESSGFNAICIIISGSNRPKASGFEKPYIEPAEYGHAIPFHNGSVACIISRDRPAHPIP
jgi:hypothetical protein